MKFFFIILFFLISSNASLFGQQISGTVFEMNGEIPVEFVNIGIVGKNVGTIADQNGKYKLQIKPEYYSDTLCFSSIGYYPYSVKVSDFIDLNNGNVSLAKRLYSLTEVVVRPKKYRQKTLGITERKRMDTYIHEAENESGTLMNNSGIAIIKEVNINIVGAGTSDIQKDSILLRINIYKVHQEKQFENILSSPILTKQGIKHKITVDLRHLNLVVEGNFLVTFERLSYDYNNYVGLLFLPIGDSSHNSYVRRASHGTWVKLSGGISISVLVDVEK